MTLIEDWDLVLKKAWSVKFSAVSALLTGAEVAVQIIQPTGVPNMLFGIMAGIVSMMAIGARVLAQKEVSGAANP